MSLIKSKILPSLFMCLFIVSSSMAATTSIETMADFLTSEQLPDGTWGETGFTGETTIGLSLAYSVLGDETYKTATENAGNAFLQEAEYDADTGFYTYSLYASEAYALIQLSENSDNPQNNTWRTAAIDYFEEIASHTDNTQGFIDTIVANYGADYICTAVYDLARFTITAHYVQDTDLSVWRNSIINTLADVAADSDCPTTALASAVWALSVTGDLDNTTLSGTGYLNGETLSQLPSILADLQAPDGSFFWDFAENDPGYIEPTVISQLALKAAGGYAAEVEAANSALLSGIEPDGSVHFKLGDTTTVSTFYFSGEVLEVITDLTLFIRGDCNSDNRVDIADPIFILRYLFNDGAPATCMDTMDANDDGRVDIADPITVIKYLFVDGGPLPVPFEECGIDPTDDQVTCQTYSHCSN